MENDSTTVVDNPSDEHVPGASVAEDPASTTESTQKPQADEDNSDTSKSTEKSADDDKSTENTTDPKEDTPVPTPKFDDDLDDWITKRKAPAPKTDEERQAYQDLRNEQREYSRAQEAKKQTEELSKAIDDNKVETDDDEDEDDDPLEKRLKELEKDRQEERTNRLQSEFYSEHKVTEEEGKAIADVFKEKIEQEVDKADKIAAFNYWSNPKRLNALLKEARVNLSTADTDVKIEAAQQEERERIAKESEANSANRGAKQTVTKDDKSDNDRRLENFSNW